MLKFLTTPPPPSTPKSHPRAWPWQPNEHSVQYNFYLSFVGTNTKFGINIFEIKILMIDDHLTSPQGHQFDPRMKMVLAFCYARHPRRFDMPHDHVWKTILTPWAPPVPQSPTPGAWPRRQNKNPVWYVLYNTHKVWYKNPWNWFKVCNWN